MWVWMVVVVVLREGEVQGRVGDGWSKEGGNVAGWGGVV